MPALALVHLAGRTADSATLNAHGAHSRQARLVRVRPALAAMRPGPMASHGWKLRWPTTDQNGRLAGLGRLVPRGCKKGRCVPWLLGGCIFLESSRSVTRGQELAEWDPWSTPILTEYGGRVKFIDLVEGATFIEQVDETTGLSRKSPDVRGGSSISQR